MKIKKIIPSLLIITVLLCGVAFNAFAMNTGFTTDDMELDEQQAFLSNINLSLVTEEPEKNAIDCFDVNDDGLIAIGSQNSTGKIISVYTSDGAFKYGYKFDCDGSFGVEWDNGNIIIYFVRSDIAASFDSAGINSEMKIIQNTTENNSYWNHSVFSKQKTVNESQYTVKNDMGLLNVFAPSYSQLVKEDADGSVITIYDVGGGYATSVVIILIAVILFAVLVVSVLILRFKKAYKERMASRQ